MENLQEDVTSLICTHPALWMQYFILWTIHTAVGKPCSVRTSSWDGITRHRTHTQTQATQQQQATADLGCESGMGHAFALTGWDVHTHDLALVTFQSLQWCPSRVERGRSTCIGGGRWFWSGDEKKFSMGEGYTWWRVVVWTIRSSYHNLKQLLKRASRWEVTPFIAIAKI